LLYDVTDMSSTAQTYAPELEEKTVFELMALVHFQLLISD